MSLSLPPSCSASSGGSAVCNTAARAEQQRRRPCLGKHSSSCSGTLSSGSFERVRCDTVPGAASSCSNRCKLKVACEIANELVQNGARRSVGVLLQALPQCAELLVVTVAVA